jgi:hypothetical protein
VIAVLREEFIEVVFAGGSDDCAADGELDAP